MGREEAGLGAARHLEQGLGLDHGGGRTAHQLVGRDADRHRQPKPIPHLALHPRRDVYRGTEEPAGAGEIEKGVAVTTGLDDGCVDPKDLVQRPRGTRIEMWVGWQQHEIGAELERVAHRHALSEAGPPRLAREGENGGALGAGRGHGDRPGAQRRGDDALDRSTEGRRVDEEHGARHGR